jgi:hypothetical protein
VLAICNKKWSKEHGAIQSINSAIEAIRTDNSYDCPTTKHCCASTLIFDQLKTGMTMNEYAAYDSKCIKPGNNIAPCFSVDAARTESF